MKKFFEKRCKNEKVLRKWSKHEKRVFEKDFFVCGGLKNVFLLLLVLKNTYREKNEKVEKFLYMRKKFPMLWIFFEKDFLEKTTECWKVMQIDSGAWEQNVPSLCTKIHRKCVKHKCDHSWLEFVWQRGTRIFRLKSSIFYFGRDKKFWRDFGIERNFSATNRPIIGQY